MHKVHFEEECVSIIMSLLLSVTTDFFLLLLSLQKPPPDRNEWSTGSQGNWEHWEDPASHVQPSVKNWKQNPCEGITTRETKAVRKTQPPERKPHTDEHLSINLSPWFLLTFLSICFSNSSFSFLLLSLQESELPTKVWKSTKYIVKVWLPTPSLFFFPQMSENPRIQPRGVLTKSLCLLETVIIGFEGIILFCMRG